MQRIACLWVPDMCVRAHLRLDPELSSVPLVLADGPSMRSVIVASSARACEFGVVVGMKTTQARAMCVPLVVRTVSADALNASATALADVASTVSARVEVDDHGRVFLDCDGSGLLWASEAELASMLSARAARCGLPARIGIADSKLGAAVAAHQSSGVTIVPPRQTRAFLAPHSVRLLEPDPDSAATLASWGVRSIGDLAALSGGAVAHRLGPAGTMLVRRARGEDDVPLAARTVPQSFEESLDLDCAVDRLEPLLFVLRRLIECVTRRIALFGLGCREISLGLQLDNGGRDFRTIVAAAPTAEHKVFVSLVRAQLETTPVAAAVTKVAVAGTATWVAPEQLDLLRPIGPTPAVLASTLARLAALCGSDRVGVLRSADSHRPDAVELRRFTGDGSSRGRGHPASNLRVVRMALRAFRPPVQLEVFECRGHLDYVRGSGFGGRVVHCAGPWRLRGEWWTADPFAREYYDVELSDGGVYRVYRDARARCWLADGVYD